MLTTTPTIRQFPINIPPPSIKKSAEKNVLLYFHTGEDADKQSGQEICEHRKSKYKIQLLVGPKSTINKITSTLKKMHLGKPNDLRIHISGHSAAINPETLTWINPVDRRIGSRSLNEIFQVVSYIITTAQAQTVKIHLASCETGIMPGHPIYKQINAAEEEHHGRPMGSNRKVSANIELIEKIAVTPAESSAEYLAQKLKNQGHTHIQIVGVNGTLLTDNGKTNAVISRDFYSNKKSYLERLKMFFALKQAIELNKYSEIEKLEHTNLMHVRKVKIKI